MSTAARKARKRAGIPFERVAKVPSRAYETPQGLREGRSAARRMRAVADAAIAAVAGLARVGKR